jgi:uncharacterized protein YifN (PemK superfamily)
VPPEMSGTGRPCVVVQNNVLTRGALVTVVPLSSTEPETPGQKHHHPMNHLSFRDLPPEWEPGLPRWAKCDYLATVSLDRCTDPYRHLPYGGRRYIKMKIIKADLEAIEKCVLFALGIDPSKHHVVEAPKVEEPPKESK